MKTWRLHARAYLSGIVAGAFVVTYGIGPSGIAVANAADPPAAPVAPPAQSAPSAPSADAAPPASPPKGAAGDVPADSKAAVPPVSAAPSPSDPPATTEKNPLADADAAPPPAKPPARRSLIPAFITGGLAIASAAVGTAFGVLALQEKSNFNSNPTSSTADAGENDALVADMAFGIALTLGVTSLVLFLDKDDDFQEGTAKGKSKRPSVVASKPASTPITITPAPIVTRNGGGLGAVIRF